MFRTLSTFPLCRGVLSAVYFTLPPRTRPQIGADGYHHPSNNAGSVTGFSQAKAAAKKDGVKTILFFGILIGLKEYSTSARPFATHCSYEGFCGGSLENLSSGKGTTHDCYSTTWEPCNQEWLQYAAIIKYSLYGFSTANMWNVWNCIFAAVNLTHHHQSRR